MTADDIKALVERLQKYCGTLAPPIARGLTHEAQRALTSLSAQVEALDLENQRLRADAERLDYLDWRNDRKNKLYGTRYGWRLEENHNRVALADHHFPVLTVREAIDAAREQIDKEKPC